MLAKAIEESMKSQPPNIDDMFTQAAIAMSKNDHICSQRITPAMQVGLANGFSLEQVIEAQQVVGDDGDMILAYLFDKIS